MFGYDMEKMEKPVEVVISHDILQVPCGNTTQYVWAGTQTFTIMHLSDQGADSPRCELETGVTNADVINQETDVKTPPLTNGYAFVSTVAEKSKEAEHAVVGADSSDGSAIESTDCDNTQANKSPLLGCGICEEQFDSEMPMHYHRITHFGLNSEWTGAKKCFLCNQNFHSVEKLSAHFYEHYSSISEDSLGPFKQYEKFKKRLKRAGSDSSDADNSLPNNKCFQSVEKLSVHLFEHYTGISEDKSKKCQKFKKRRKNDVSDKVNRNQPLKSINNHKKPAKSSKNYDCISTASTQKICYLPSELQCQNYPVTNNDRLELMISSSSSSSPHVSPSSISNNNLTLDNNCKYNTNPITSYITCSQNQSS